MRKTFTNLKKNVKSIKNYYIVEFGFKGSQMTDEKRKLALKLIQKSNFVKISVISENRPRSPEIV